MLPKIFDVDGSVLIINENILSIPELKDVYEAYDDPKPALLFLRYICDPIGPYSNVAEDIKEEVIFSDFPGDYTTEDEVIIQARKKLESLYMTPTYRYYLDNKKLLEGIGSWARTAQVRDQDKGGNLGQILAQINSLAKSMVSFRQFEKMAEEELQKSRVRGGAFESYDSDDE